MQQAFVYGGQGTPFDSEAVAVRPQEVGTRYSQWRGLDSGHEEETVTWCGVRYRYQGYAVPFAPLAAVRKLRHYYRKEILSKMELSRVEVEVNGSGEGEVQLHEPGTVMVVKEQWVVDEVVSFEHPIFGFWPRMAGFKNETYRGDDAVMPRMAGSGDDAVMPPAKRARQIE